MSDIKRIQNDEFAGFEGNYGIRNHGTGYAVINILTKEMKAHNISSYLDALKTAEYLANKDKEKEVIELETTPVPLPITQLNEELDRAITGLKPNLQELIKKYAPETRRVEKSSNFLGYTWYKCYDKSGDVLGRIRGTDGDRYWQYGGLDSKKYY